MYIIFKLLKNENKEKILKQAKQKKKRQITYRVTKIRKYFGFLVSM